MDGELAYVNTDILLKPSYNYNSSQLAFSYLRPNFVVNHDVYELHHSVIKIRLGLHFFATLSRITCMINATYASYPPLLNIDILVL